MTENHVKTPDDLYDEAVSRSNGENDTGDVPLRTEKPVVPVKPRDVDEYYDLVLPLDHPDDDRDR